MIAVETACAVVPPLVCSNNDDDDVEGDGEEGEEDEAGEPEASELGDWEAVTMVPALVELQGRTVVLGIEDIVGWLDPTPALVPRAGMEIDRSVLADGVAVEPCFGCVEMVAMLWLAEF